MEANVKELEKAKMAILESIVKSGTGPNLFHKNEGLWRAVVKIDLKKILELFVEIHESQCNVFYFIQ